MVICGESGNDWKQTTVCIAVSVLFLSVPYFCWLPFGSDCPVITVIGQARGFGIVFLSHETELA